MLHIALRVKIVLGSLISKGCNLLSWSSALLRGQEPEDYVPQKSFLALLNTSDGDAIGRYKGLAFGGSLTMTLKVGPHSLPLHIGCAPSYVALHTCIRELGSYRSSLHEDLPTGPLRSVSIGA